MAYDLFSSTHQSFLSSITENKDPTDPIWVEAMDKELKALYANKTWTITFLPLGKRAIGCKWVLRTKFDLDGTISKHKAHLVAKGYT